MSSSLNVSLSALLSRYPSGEACVTVVPVSGVLKRALPEALTGPDAESAPDRVIEVV